MAFDPAPRNIRNSIKSFIPNWLSDRPALNAGFSVIYTVALAADMFVEQMFQGWMAPYPGLGTPTALPLIGQTRNLPRGLLETDDAYAARLRAWLAFWTNQAGSEEAIAQGLQIYLGNNLVVRHINRKGVFVTANADGTTTKTVDTNWDWDSDIPARSQWFGDGWVVIYLDRATEARWPVYTSRSDPAFLAAWGTHQGLGSGLQIPRNVVDGIYDIIARFKAAHTWISAVIFTEDTSLFVPGSLGGIPDGDFGNWSDDEGGHQHPSRITQSSGTKATRYMIPRFGG